VIGRVAAIDYGTKRIGLAVCDPLGITIRGLDTVTRPPDEAAAVAAVAAVLRELGVVRLVVGLPLHADGRASPMSEAARAFGDALGRALAREVVYLDEGLTSWEAEEDVKASGKRLRGARDRGEVDRAAARSILRSYLRSLEDASRPHLDPGTGG